jgi:hypothetical protein
VRRLATAVLTAGVAALATLAGCSRPATSEEHRGDAHYAAARYSQALSAYRSALGDRTDAELLGKVGVAALRAGDAAVAADAFLRLADAEPPRALEAAEGLVQAGRMALEADDPATLRIVLDGLRGLAPERVVGRWALSIVRREGEAAGTELLPVALAAATDPAVADSLLLAYASALRAAGDCGRAVSAFDAVRRRRRIDVPPAASEAAAACALRLGDGAAEAGDTAAAMLWLERAIAADSASETGRSAVLRLQSLVVPDSADDSVRTSFP